MRHKKNRLIEFNTGVKKRKTVEREMLTSLVKHWKMKTTPKKAKVLKALADKFFAKLMDLSTRYEDEKDGIREVTRYVKSVIYGDEGKIVIQKRLPKYKEENKTSWFVADYKLGFRKGDGVEEILVKLI